MVAIKNVQKSFALYKDKHQNKVDMVLMLCFFKFDCISVATLSMYFVDWFNLANVKNIMLAFIRIVVYFQ